MKENKYKLESRYPEVITVVEELSDNRGIVSTTGAYIRCIMEQDNKTIHAIDFEGGPMLSVGDSLIDVGLPKKIKSLRAVWLIEFEE